MKFFAVIWLLCLVGVFGCAGGLVGGDMAESGGHGSQAATLQPPVIYKTTVVDDSAVTISWHQPGTVMPTEFRVSIGIPNNSGYMRTLDDVLGPDVRFYTFGGLARGEVYLVKVEAIRGGYVAASSIVEIQSDFVLAVPPPRMMSHPSYTPLAYDGRTYICLPEPNDDIVGGCANPDGQRFDYTKLNPALDGMVQNIPSTCHEAPDTVVRRLLVWMPSPNTDRQVYISQFTDVGGFSPAALLKTTAQCTSGQWVDILLKTRYVRVDGVPEKAGLFFALITWDRKNSPTKVSVRTSFPVPTDSATGDTVLHAVDIGSVP